MTSNRLSFQIRLKPRGWCSAESYLFHSTDKRQSRSISFNSSFPLISYYTNMPVAVTAPRTLYDKIWDDHVVWVITIELVPIDIHDCTFLFEATLRRTDWHLFISTGPSYLSLLETLLTPFSRHLVHEVTSPQAFEGLWVPYSCAAVNRLDSLAPLVVMQVVLFVARTALWLPWITMSRMFSKVMSQIFRWSRSPGLPLAKTLSLSKPLSKNPIREHNALLWKRTWKSLVWHILAWRTAVRVCYPLTLSIRLLIYMIARYRSCYRAWTRVYCSSNWSPERRIR